MSALEVFAPEIGFVPGSPVITGVNLNVARGEVVAVLGGNGAGKTALLRWIAGLLPRRGGRCLVNGVPVASPRDAVACGLGFVVQDPNDQLLAGTVVEDVELGPRNLGCAATECRERADAALARVELSALADRDIEALSLGERKRASLAGVLAMSPRLLLLDEPTAGLDPGAELAVCETLRSLSRVGITQVIATHAIDLVPHFATRVLVIAEGCVAADGPCRDVLAERELLLRARLRRPWSIELWDQVLRKRGVAPTLTFEEVRSCLATAFS
jgi:cobalt/nickel transport system ATP-binding protein